VLPTPDAYRPAGWWAHVVGALRVHPHKHDANYPPQKDRGFARVRRVMRRNTRRQSPQVARGRNGGARCRVGVRHVPPRR